MSEVSLSASPDVLRELADFLHNCANLLDEPPTPNWHRHIPDSLMNKLGGDIIILAPGLK